MQGKTFGTIHSNKFFLLLSLFGMKHVNIYKPGVLFVGHMQTVQTKIRC